jgi:hypothetical protein
VVIADATKRLAESFFEYDDLGAVHLKNFEKRVQAWRVLRETAVVSRFEARRLYTSQKELVGRAGELRALADAWMKARSGKGQVICLIGDAGMGKSLLARAALDRATSEGATRFEIDCTPATRNSPLYPVGVLLRRIAGIEARASESEVLMLARQFLARFLGEDMVAGTMRYLAPLFGLQGSPVPDDSRPEEVREQTIAAVVRLFRSLGVQGPLVMLCEDLHWADDTTATVIQRIAEESAALPVLLILTTRPSAEASLAVDRIADGYKEIVLERLADPTASDLVRRIAGSFSLSADQVQAIVGRCEGVPLILEEVTRATVENAARGQVLDVDAGLRGTVPAALQLVVESRLDRWQKYKALVQAAAVLGREFSIGLLEEIVPDRAGQVVEAIRMLADHGFFGRPAESAAGRARFTHAMIRDAVYQTLLRDDRRWLHSRAADTLIERHQGSPEASAELLAQHLVEANRFLEAVRVRLAASADTAARGAYVETEGHCNAALAVVGKLDDAGERRTLQFRLLVQLGQALTGRHGYSAPQVEDVYRRARAVCDETTEAAMLYQTMRGLTALNLVRGNLATGYELSVQSMEIAEKSSDTAFRIDAMSVHCYATLYYRRLDECRSWIKQCLELYRREGGERLKYPVPNDAGVAAIAILPTVEWLLGDSEAAEEAIREGLDLVERLGQDFSRAYMHAWTAGTRFTQRRYRESAEHARIAVEISAKHGFEEWYVTGLLVGLLAEASLAPSPEKLAQALETCTGMAAKGAGLNASWYLWGLALGYRLAGLGPVAQQLVAQAFRSAEQSGETRMNPELLILQAELEPVPEAGIALLTRALNMAEEQGAVANALRAAAELTRRSSQDGAAQEAARTTLELLEGRGNYPGTRGWMQERLTLLKAALQIPPAAVKPA